MVKLRAAIVGCGRIASADHAFAHAADPRVHLAAVVDPDHDRARALARRFGVREVFTSLEEMLATTDVDLVSICAPPHLRVPLATTALRADCHVLCERPDADDATGLARLATIASARHRVLTFGFPYRHLTEARAARDLVDAGHVGEIHDIQLTARGCREAGAGQDCRPLTDIGVHLLDLVMWITGFPEVVDTLAGVEALATAPATSPDPPKTPASAVPPASALAPASAVAPASVARLAAAWGVSRVSRVGDLTTALVRCRDGTSVSISTSPTPGPDDEETVRVRLLGDRGSLELFPLLLSHPNLPAPGHITPPLSGRPQDHRLAHQRQTAAFVDACLGRGPVPVTFAEVRHVQDIVHRLHLTYRLHQPSRLHRSSDSAAFPEATATHPETNPPAETPTPVDDDLVQEASHG